MRIIFILTAYLMASSSLHADPAAPPKYFEILGPNATVEDCATKIAANMIAAGKFSDVRATEFRCRAEFLKTNRYNCSFRAQDQAATPNRYKGNVEVVLRRRIDEDPRTGVRTESRYCRIAASCWFNSPWPFRLRNVNGTLIQVESACALDSDRLFESL